MSSLNLKNARMPVNHKCQGAFTAMTDPVRVHIVNNITRCIASEEVKHYNRKSFANS